MTHNLHECALTASRADAERLAAALSEAENPLALSVSLFETREGPWRVAAHYEDDTCTGPLTALLHNAGWTGAFAFSPVPDEDWVARSQAFLAPVRAGRFLVHGSHDRAKARGRHAIEIDANRAFGTAHHETTRGCLLMLDALLKHARPKRVLDLGCGSGVLAIAGARALKTRIIASDNDPVAARIAAANASANGEAMRITTLVAHGLEHPVLRASAHFDLVFANILLGPLLDLAPDLSRKIAPGGWLILSGINPDQLRALEPRYRSLGLVSVARLILGDWAVVLMRRAAITTAQSCFR